MPIITPSSKVLVSGANGYLACWVIRTFLEKGHAVRGAVRSPEKGGHLLQLFKSFGEKFELVIVSDITKDGAFDEAVKGVDAIAHTASPLSMTGDDPRELIEPALNGTVGMLRSALKNGSAVKRIVITSSTGTVREIVPETRTFSEVDWNNRVLEELEEQGRNAPFLTKYQASKVLAEKAAWDFCEQHKDKITWDLVVLIPPYIFGPSIQEVTTPATLNVSIRSWYNAVFGKGPQTEDYLCRQGPCWVDVRDLAEAHVRSLEREQAGGERIIISADEFVWNDWIEVAKSLSPSLSQLARGYPGFKPVYTVHYDATKSVELLGMTYTRTKEEVTMDLLAEFNSRGWLTTLAASDS